jgi:hypothetical protein
MNVVELINKYGFPIIAAFGLGYFVHYTWIWVTLEVKPVVTSANKSLIDLIDRIRKLDNDLIRLNEKVETVLQLRGRTIDIERSEADKQINNKNHQA